jgi:signal transduction histidine kinase
MEAEELSHVFERFYRSDKSRSRNTGGAGIGLTIVQTIVIAHGGQVRAESTVGKGSVFTVLLPRGTVG